MNKQAFYKRVNIKQNKITNASKLKAYGIKYEFTKDGKSFCAFYDSNIKMFTESYSGMLINSRAQKNIKTAVAQVYNYFDMIYNHLQKLKKQGASVETLPEVLSAEGV